MVFKPLPGFLSGAPAVQKHDGPADKPLYYLYALAVCYSDFRLRPRYLWHLLPFGLLTLALLPRFYLAGEAAKHAFMENYWVQPEVISILRLGQGQFVGYIVAVFVVLRKYNESYRENYTDTSSITYTWLFQLTAIITVLHIIVVVKTGSPPLVCRGRTPGGPQCHLYSVLVRAQGALQSHAVPPH